MKKITTKKLVLSSLFLALGLILPLLTAQIPSISNKLLPMHLPILLCGFILGWPYGLIIGFITPILRSAIFGMPPMYPIALAMAFELGTYGLISGLAYKLFAKNLKNVYISLLVSMIGGRIVLGLVNTIFFKLAGNVYTWKIFMTGAFLNAIPGIIVQLVIIPILISSLKKKGLIYND